METSELLQRVRHIEIKTRALADSIFSGEYHSAFKGRGMSFAEVREYQEGDEVHDIDWNVTARLDRPFIKVYEEERELTVMLVIDVSESLNFGTVSRSMRELAAEIAATLAFSAARAGDKIGALFFSDRIEKFIPPAKGRKHILLIIRELLGFKPSGIRTNVGMAVEYLTRLVKKRCIAFLLSDFLDFQDYATSLTIASRKHDVVALKLFDRRLAVLPDVGLMKVMDAETGHEVYLDTSSKKVRMQHSVWWNKEQRRLDELFNKCRVDNVAISTDEDYVKKLMFLFRKRKG